MDFDVESPLQLVRYAVSVFAIEAGITAGRTGDLVLAVNELATNSLRHGGGRGTLHIWSDKDSVICEVRDQGRIGEPLIGREHPAGHRDGGRRLWLVNQLCDLVQLRTRPAGSVVRLYMSRPS